MQPPPIIIVDDSEDDRALLEMAIGRSGVPCRTIMLRSSEEALAYIRRKGRYAKRSYHDQPILFLLDIQLDVLTGFDILHEIRKDVELRLVPILMLSSSDEPSDIRLAYEKGANGYIQKSGDFDNVIKGSLCFWLTINHTSRWAPTAK